LITGILSGLRIVEVAAYVAAPLAGVTLASLGAEVIRIEQLGGGIDAFRWPVYDGRSLYRQGLDQGKRSVSVDLRSSLGQQLVADLVTAPGDDAGILITNLPDRDWLAYGALAARRPDLIMVVIQGTREGGHAVDYTINAGVGFPWVTGLERWEGPVNHVLPAWDVATGFLTTTAVLAAERHRRLTGAGQLVQLALSDVALAVAGHLGFLAEARLLDEPRGRFGNYLYGTYGRDFRTRDGRLVMVCALTARQWQGLGTATGLSSRFRELEIQYGVGLDDEGERFIHRKEISLLLDPWIASRSLDEVRAAFDANDVLWSPYRTFKELLRDDSRASNLLASPLAFAGFESQPAPPAPEIGADTHRVFREVLQLEASYLAVMRELGVIS
jgi:2-methylfumaryl-CoA isomerase